MKRSLALVMVAAIALLTASYGYQFPMRVDAAQVQPETPTIAPPVIAVPGTAPTVNPERPSQSAVSVKEVESPAAPSHYGDQMIWAIMVSWVIEYLKKKAWFPWITQSDSARLKAQFGFVTALMTAAGIHFAVTGSVLDGSGAAITISGLSLDAFLDVGWQWAAQQSAYNLLVKEKKA